MFPGDFKLEKPPKKRLILFGALGGVGLVVFIGVALVLTFVVSSWLGRPVVFGFDDGPAQPIAFPHTTHVQELELDCTFCHRNVTEGDAATIPAVGLCITCHKTVGEDSPEIEKLRDAFSAGQPIDWVRVHRVPDHVQFTHEPHIRFFSEKDNIAASQVCTVCHGEVGDMEVVRQVRSLKMGDCVGCHRENDAPTDCATCHY